MNNKRRKSALADMMVQVPPPYPKRNPPSRRVVFVDPDDINASWWWPALVVPKSELKVFRSMVEGEVDEPGPGQLLVSYFEDGSFSIVPESDTIPFCPYRPPYTTYLLGQYYNAFRQDKSILLATLYWETGIVPPTFAWLKSQSTDDRTGLETFPLKESLEHSKRRCIQLYESIKESEKPVADMRPDESKESLVVHKDIESEEEIVLDDQNNEELISIDDEKINN